MRRWVDLLRSNPTVFRTEQTDPCESQPDTFPLKGHRSVTLPSVAPYRMPLLKPPSRAGIRRAAFAAAAVALLSSSLGHAQAEEPTRLTPCRLKGVGHGALCGSLHRPLDPAAPDGTQIELHYAVLPALARNKKADPVFFFAGGPGQSALGLAGPLSRQYSRFINRRDFVLVDQRGTGKSAPLYCEADAATRPLRELADPAKQAELLQACRAQLQKLPHGDLRHYSTSVAMADIDAVRRALGAAQINLMGGSYGSRAVLDYLRLFPQTVRRAVVDGVAPPDMVLPASFSTDAQAALESLLRACEAAQDCRSHYPRLRAQWAELLGGLPRSVSVAHPLTGVVETLTVSRDMVTGMVRPPLYVPSLASALPFAISEAAQGRFGALVGLSGSLGGGRGDDSRLAMGMHFSVVCSEDLPRLAATTDTPGPDFGDSMARLYQRTCDGWPRATVAPDFYRIPPSPVAVLLLSGGLDPVTPPRHGARAAVALGPLARHVTVPNVGHGVMSVACIRDAVFRFIDADTETEAQTVDADCAQAVPRPLAFQPVRAPVAPAPAEPANPARPGARP